jgi:putative glycosyltransferase (TIGR04372 family)
VDSIAHFCVDHGVFSQWKSPMAAPRPLDSVPAPLRNAIRLPKNLLGFVRRAMRTSTTYRRTVRKLRIAMIPRSSWRAAFEKADPRTTGSSSYRERKGAAALFSLAMEALERFDSATAERLLRAATRLDPDCTTTRWELGNLLMDQGRNRCAESEFRAIVARQPDHANALLHLSYTLDRQGRALEALEAYRNCSAVRPEWAELHHTIGHLLIRLGRDAEAVESLRRAGEANPAWVDAPLSLGHHLAQMGRLAESEAAHERAVANAPRHIQANQALVNMWNRRGKFDLAAERIHAMLEREEYSARLHIWAGYALVMAGKYDEAVTLLEGLLRREPHETETREWLIEAYFRQNDWERAAQACRIAFNPEHESITTLRLVGNRLNTLGHFAEARVQWERAIALDPARLDTYTDIWSSLSANGQFEDAAEFYRRNRAAQRMASGEASRTRYLTRMWSCQIGHLTHLDTYVKIGLLGLRESDHTVLVATTPKCIANRAYFAHWRPFIDLLDDPAEAERLQPKIAAAEDYLSMNSLETEALDLWAPIAAATVQKRWEAEGRGPLLKLSDAEAERGRACLERLGLPKGAWFVAIHVRDNGFHGSDSSQTFRNADIASYLPAIRSVVARGGWVVRLGDAAMKPLEPMPGVIDYARSGEKSDWMDVYLCAACRFLIGTQSGLSLLPSTFGVPVAMTNWSTMGTPPWYGSDLFIPKIFHASGRRMNYAEVMDDRFLAFTQNSIVFSVKQVGVEDNTAEEIDELVCEMLDRIEGRDESTAEDERLWKRFADYAEARGIVVGSRLGRGFLRKHAALLPNGGSD